MLNKIKVIKQYTINCLDGEIGKVKDVYFEDQTWTLKYLVVNTGNWLTGRQVLISPYSITSVNNDEEIINIDLTKGQIEDSPILASDKPVSLQYQSEFHGYFQYPLYTNTMQYGGTWNILPTTPINDDARQDKPTIVAEDEYDPHLRSMKNVTGYGIQALDDTIGHVEDFIVDDKTWKIYYLEIDTKNWLPGKKVIISPNWIDSINWNEAKVFVNLTLDEIKQSPEYTEESKVDRDYETELYTYYNRDAYWLTKEEDKTPML